MSTDVQSDIDRRKFIFTTGTVCLLGSGVPIGPQRVDVITVKSPGVAPAHLNTVEMPLINFHGTLEEFKAYVISTLDNLAKAVKENNYALGAPVYFNLSGGVISQADRLQQVLDGVVLYRTPAAVSAPEPEKEESK